MTIPPYQNIFAPLLNICADEQTHSLNEVHDTLALHFKLNQEEINELLPSGKQTIFRNRIGWAKTYLVKAHVLESTGRAMFRITPRGKKLHAQNLEHIDTQVLNQYDEFKVFQGRSNSTNIEKSQTPVIDKGIETPEEILAAAYQAMREQLAATIIESVLDCSPVFFERLVLDLLLAMGYGGSRKEAAMAVGRSADGGIDGIINEDRLGLDAIYIQAKRWQASVGSPVVRDFVGSLVGHSAHKGILITTAQFTAEAKRYAERVPQKVILIDGFKLAELMIDFNIGVIVQETYAHKKINEGYFSEE